jgi:hypothetical protein
VCSIDPADKQEDVHQIHVHPFSPSLRELRKFLDDVTPNGGGDREEDYIGAIEAILALNWRPTAKHGIAWITDSNAHG